MIIQLFILFLHIKINNSIDNPKLVALMYLIINILLFRTVNYNFNLLLIFIIAYYIYWGFFYALNKYYEEPIYYILIITAVGVYVYPEILTHH